MAKATVSVSVSDGNVEKAIGKLKLQLARGGTLSKVRDRKFYESRHKKRKRQAEESRRKSRKKNAA
ncbi:MAG: 30S ribosomal protein S21 [Bacilli bacterium]